MISSSSVYHFKLTLSHISPPIWRRVEVPDDVSLYRLAAVSIIAMGWHGGHLHQFPVGKKYYGIPNEDDFMEILDERKITLRDIVEKQGVKKFIFDYDFGDGWEHVIQLEKTVEPQEGVRYPRCTAGARACPPEDCGGPSGYEDFLKAIGDPKHPEHEEMCEWIGREFDPEEFDPGERPDFVGDVKFQEDEWQRHF